MTATTVILQTPALRHADEFLRSVRLSRTLHKGFTAAPRTREAYRRYLAGNRRRNRAAFLVTMAGSGNIAGVVNVSEIVQGPFKSAYLGYYAFVPFAGRGLMRKGLQKVIDHCFGALRLHRLEANIQPGNLRSIALVRGLGFRKEGFSPRYLKVGGTWRDHERWAILAEEWRK